jgi:hypothetical protein
MGGREGGKEERKIASYLVHTAHMYACTTYLHMRVSCMFTYWHVCDYLTTCICRKSRRVVLLPPTLAQAVRVKEEREQARERAGGGVGGGGGGGGVRTRAEERRHTWDEG